MAAAGNITVGKIGASLQVSADGQPEYKLVGGTIDWTTVAAVTGADVEWLDGVVVKIGEKGLRYGQVVCRITASKKYGPYDPGAADGRQTLTVGECFICNRSVRELEPLSDYPALIYGGYMWEDRIIHSALAAHTLALGPTYAELRAAFPLMQPQLDAA